MRALFRNARIIGRRFRLVHVDFAGKIIEVSTFRSRDGQNSFGTIDQDVLRRDFTINALYYSPEKEQIIDYVGGYHDVVEGRIRALVPLETTFDEDPVRMIRAAKYAAITHFELSSKLRSKIKKSADGLAGCSPSRMTEEVLKILASGNSAVIFEQAKQLGIFPYMLIEIGRRIERRRSLWSSMILSLSGIDGEICSQPEAIPRARLISALVEPFLSIEKSAVGDRSEFYKELFAQTKRLLHPITPPNNDVHEAIKVMMLKNGITPPPKPRRRRRRPQQETK